MNWCLLSICPLCNQVQWLDGRWHICEGYRSMIEKPKPPRPITNPRLIEAKRLYDEEWARQNRLHVVSPEEAQRLKGLANTTCTCRPIHQPNAVGMEYDPDCPRHGYLLRRNLGGS
jgi:hypothetical protein